jgi:hypothetical protein
VSPKKVVDDLVCPKYIVDVMSPSISTLVEHENKKTRYYAIASINDCHYLNIWADGCPRDWSSVKITYWVMCRTLISTLRKRHHREEVRDLQFKGMEDRPRADHRNSVTVHVLGWETSLRKKTLKSPKLF